MNKRASAVLVFSLASPALGAAPVGTYRCWSDNVGGAGGRCSSPPIVLKEDGTYAMSSERGTFTVKGDRIDLSQSKIRGPGRLEEGGDRIVFHYSYRGWEHTVTYVRRDSGAAASAPAPGARSGPRAVPVEATLVFPASDGSVGWINTASLVPEGGSLEKERYDALARGDGKLTIRASFREVPAGRVYALYVGSGFETRAVSTVDLRGAAGPVGVTVSVKPAAK